MSAPATQIFEYGEWTNTNNEENGPKNAYTVYGESIYIGYRYYETRYEDTVLGQGNASTQTANTITPSRFSTHLDMEFPTHSLITATSL